MRILLSAPERMLVIEGLGELPLKHSLSLYSYFKELDDNDKKDYEFDFSREDLDIIVAALGELKASRTFYLIRRIDAMLLEVEVKNDNVKGSDDQRVDERGESGITLGSSSESSTGEDTP